MRESAPGDTCRRAERYIKSLSLALDSIPDNIKNNYVNLIDAIERYMKDAIYYASKGDCDTALVAVSYAEGLLDSLKYTGVLDPAWPSEPIEEKRVFVAGTFDIIHPGHIDLLEYAARLGKLYVVVARDSNVEKQKGKKPLLSENSRLRVVSAVRYVYEARLGDPKDYMRPVREIQPDVIVLGPDQPFDPERLSAEISRDLGKPVRVIRFGEKREFEAGLRSSSDIIRKACCGSYCRIVGCEQDRNMEERERSS